MRFALNFSKLELIRISVFIAALTIIVFCLPSVTNYFNNLYCNQVEIISDNMLKSTSYYLTF